MQYSFVFVLLSYDCISLIVVNKLLLFLSLYSAPILHTSLSILVIATRGYHAMHIYGCRIRRYCTLPVDSRISYLASGMVWMPRLRISCDSQVKLQIYHGTLVLANFGRWQITEEINDNIVFHILLLQNQPLHIFRSMIILFIGVGFSHLYVCFHSFMPP